MAQKAVLDSGSLQDWLKTISSSAQLMAPVRRGRTSFAFTQMDDPADVRLDYVRTVLSPKQAFLPSREPLLSVQRGSMASAPQLMDAPFVLFGVHPCDLMAINQLDWSMLKRHGIEDPYYRSRRNAATIVALDCLPDKYCFCTSVGSSDTREGADVFLTPLKSGYAVESLTKKGEALLKSAMPCSRLACSKPGCDRNPIMCLRHMLNLATLCVLATARLMRTSASTAALITRMLWLACPCGRSIFE